ncbi:MAG: stalk domain-containing protein, partial [Bacillota bacterium]|nr:stalk domain-containing protein [Bacillota bacterium]
MKKTLSSLIVAGMIVNAVPTIIPMNTASAAMVSKATLSKVIAGQKNISLNGINSKLSSIVYKGRTLYSAKDIAASFKAKYFFDKKTKSYMMTLKGKSISFKANSSFILANNKKVDLRAPIATYQNQMYLQIDPIVFGLGGDFIYNPQTKDLYVSTTSLVKGSSSDAQWIDKNHVVFTNELGDSVTTNVMDVSTKTVKQFNTAEMVVSPDGDQAVYA